MVELRLPNIKGATEREQLAEIRGYLFQLTEQLQFALNSIGTSSPQVVTNIPIVSSPASLASTGASTQATFNSIKSLIIKSAEIVDAYYDEINRRLEGVYVAQSDFGDFAQKTSQEIEETSTSTIQRFENIQVLITNQGSELETVKGDLQTIGADISYAEKNILTISSEIEALDGSIASVEGEVASLDTTLQTTKVELQSKVENTKSELSSTISSTKEELSGSINTVKSDLEGSLDNAKTELEGSIDSAKSELTGKVDAVDEDLQGTKTEVNGRIDDTNGSVAGLGESLNDANSRIAEVDEDLQDAKEVINSSIQGVQDRVTGVNALLEDAKATLQGSIDDLTVLITGLEEVIIGVTAYLKSGLLYYTDAGIPVYGLEIGQTVEDGISGEALFNKYARFTSEKLSFYDNNGTEVAYISDKKLYIRIAQITVAFQIGGLIDLVMANGDVVEKWVGG